MNISSLNFDSRLTRYFVAVILPTLSALFYLSFVASEGFVSRAQTTLEEDAGFSAPDIALGILSLGASGSSKSDVLLVERFMQSRTMLEYLDDQLHLFEHFSSSSVDWISRLSPRASAEEFLEYYRKHLGLSLDEESLILDVEFVAYEPEFAQKITQLLVSRSEEFVNETSHYLAREQLAFIQGEVDKADERLKKASREMITLQRKNAVFSPSVETATVGEILAGLELELARQRAAKKMLSGYLNPSAPDMVAAKNRIAALEDQAGKERQRLVGDVGLNDLMLSYQDAEVNVRLATEVYKTALASLETIRLDAARKVKYLVSVDRPSLPDSAEQPRVAYWTLSVFIFLNLGYFVFGLIVATIQDHRE